MVELAHYVTLFNQPPDVILRQDPYLLHGIALVREAWAERESRANQPVGIPKGGNTTTIRRPTGG